jgi:hypothetical protein
VHFGEGADLAEAVGYAADGEDGEDAWWGLDAGVVWGEEGIPRPIQSQRSSTWCAMFCAQSWCGA